ncbi:MAG: hypothetical protein J5822_05375 [Eubacteriaceae bacterium]|nr:hypothetical protein [Eubacteriaceae bacterium]
MDIDPRLKNTIMHVIDNQLNGSEQNLPLAYVKLAFNRLEPKYGPEEAKKKIAAVFFNEMYLAEKDGTEFNEARYKEELEKLQ